MRCGRADDVDVRRRRCARLVLALCISISSVPVYFWHRAERGCLDDDPGGIFASPPVGAMFRDLHARALWLLLACVLPSSAAYGAALSHARFARAARFSTASVGRAPAAQMAASTARGQLRARIIGVGSSAPTNVVTNTQLEAFVDTSDEWIAKRTGIRSRHLLQPGEGLPDMASNAASRALEMAGVDASEIDLVILATSSPDDLFGDAPCVARAVGATEAVAFDLTAACSGFLFGVSTASQFLHSGAYQTALVIGADALSRWVDWSDRNTYAARKLFIFLRRHSPFPWRAPLCLPG